MATDTLCCPPLDRPCSLQSAPGWGATLDPAAWLEALVGLVLAARQEDYKDLAGARGLHK
jgi:hypothetical protein